MNLIKSYEQSQILSLSSDKTVPDFKPGDTISVIVKITDSNVIRLQDYTGVVIAKRNRSINSSFVVRKISHGEGVERRFMLYSPLVKSIKILKKGIVRRSKLYYLRDRSGKAARIKEKLF